MKSLVLALCALGLAACAHTAQTSAAAAPAMKSCPMPATTDAAGAKVAFDHKPAVGEKAQCPVSGETFVVDADTVSTEYQGKWYAFCCGDCPSDFAKDPAKYAK